MKGTVTSVEDPSSLTAFLLNSDDLVREINTKLSNYYTVVGPKYVCAFSTVFQLKKRVKVVSKDFRQIQAKSIEVR